ncbi:MAG: hypothetical protein QW228_03310 [Candidatus Aenigmatarchaeota archaeon]
MYLIEFIYSKGYPISESKAEELLKNFRSKWEEVKGKGDEVARKFQVRKRYRDKSGRIRYKVNFKGKPGTGERFINCVLAQGARGYDFSTAIAICMDICGKKYKAKKGERHPCLPIAQMVKAAYRKTK